MAVHEFDSHVQKARLWIKELMEKLELDEHKSYIALRAVLHTIRDRLPMDEAVQFASELPLVIKGIYYEGWRPSATPIKIKYAEEFLAFVKRNINKTEGIDPIHVTPLVINFLSKKIFMGRIRRCKSSYP